MYASILFLLIDAAVRIRFCFWFLLTDTCGNPVCIIPYRNLNIYRKPERIFSFPMPGFVVIFIYMMSDFREESYMSTMGTFSGGRFDPLTMTPEDVVLEDIAHALSLLCRGGGQLKYFYSVGQHCINCMKEAKERGWSKRMQLACLIHDASEAYISDIIRPVKVHLSNYMEIEEHIMDKIWRRFGLDDLTEEENRRWKQIDDDVLKLELMVLIEGEENAVCEELRSCPDLSERPWRDVEEEFRDLAENLAETAEGKKCGR